VLLLLAVADAPLVDASSAGLDLSLLSLCARACLALSFDADRVGFSAPFSAANICACAMTALHATSNDVTSVCTKICGEPLAGASVHRWCKQRDHVCTLRSFNEVLGCNASVCPDVPPLPDDCVDNTAAAVAVVVLLSRLLPLLALSFLAADIYRLRLCVCRARIAPLSKSPH
jgi:hypothetical protein